MQKAKQLFLVSLMASLTACDLDYVVPPMAMRMAPAHDFNVKVTRGLPINGGDKKTRIWGEYGQLEVDYYESTLFACPRAMTVQQESKVLSYSIDDDEKQTVGREFADECAVRYANMLDVYMQKRMVNAQSFDE